MRGSRGLVPVRPRVSGYHLAAVWVEPVSVFHQTLKHIVAVRNGGPANPECVSSARLSIFSCFSRSGPARRNKCQNSRDWTKCFQRRLPRSPRHHRCPLAALYDPEATVDKFVRKEVPQPHAPMALGFAGFKLRLCSVGPAGIFRAAPWYGSIHKKPKA